MTDNDNGVRRSIRRRSFLKATGGVAGTALVAGCSGGNGGGGDGSGSTTTSGGGGGSTTTSGGGSTTTSGGGSDFPTKDITWIVPYSPGGGFDTYSRGVSQFMPKHLPNEVNVVVQNMPGAGGRTGANKVYRADPDGYTIGIWNMPGMVASQIVLDVEYDVSKVSWVGRIARSIYMMAVPTDGKYQSLDDMKNASEPVKFAVTGPGSTSYLSAIIATKVIGIDTKFVTGYEGSQESVAAALRGDVDAVQYPYPSPSIKSPVQDGDMKPIIVYAKEPPDYAPDTLTADKAGYSDLIGQVNLQRLVGGPPDIPDGPLGVLEQALLDTLKSDEFQSWADDQGRPVDPEGSQATADAVATAQETFAQYKDLLESKYAE